MEIREGLSKVREGAKSVIKSLDTRPPEVEFVDINPSSMARVILTQMGNPARKRFGMGKWANPFTVDDVFANVRIKSNPEYPTSKNDEIVKKRIKDSMDTLVESNALSVAKLETPGVARGFPFLYQVVDEQKLTELSEAKLPTEPQSA